MTATASTTRLIGNEAAVHRFVTAIQKGRASGTYLLVGPPGVGKATFAQLVAKSLLCQRPISTLEPVAIVLRASRSMRTRTPISSVYGSQTIRLTYHWNC